MEEVNSIHKFYEIFLVYLIFEAWPHYVAQASLELVISLPQSLDYRYVLRRSSCQVCGLEQEESLSF